MNQKSSVAQSPKSVRWVLTSDSLAELAESIVVHISKGEIEAVAARIWRSDTGKEGDLRYVPVLVHADIGKLAEAIARLSGPTLSALGNILKERYEITFDALDAEVDRLRELVDALEKRAAGLDKEHPIHAWQLKNLVKWKLLPAINRRAKILDN